MQNVTMQPSLETLQAQQDATQAADVSAFANKGVNLESTPAADTLEITTQEQQPKKKIGLGWILGGAAVAGAAAFGIYKMVTGRATPAKMVDEVKGIASSATDVVENAFKKSGQPAKSAVETNFIKGNDLVKDAFGELSSGKKPSFIEDLVKASKKATAEGADDAAKNAFAELQKTHKVSGFTVDADDVVKFTKELAGTGEGAAARKLVATYGKDAVEVSESAADLIAKAAKDGKLTEVIAGSGDKAEIFKFVGDGTDTLKSLGIGLTKDNKIATLVEGIKPETVKDGDKEVTKYLFDKISLGTDGKAPAAVISMDKGNISKYEKFAYDDKGTQTVTDMYDAVNNKIKLGDKDFELKDNKWSKIKPEAK